MSLIALIHPAQEGQFNEQLTAYWAKVWWSAGQRSA